MNLEGLKARAKAAEEVGSWFEYDDDPSAMPLLPRAAYIAAADPTTILSLIEEIERLRGAQNKAIGILSDRELHEATRLLDARDALVTARSALGEG